MNLSIFDFEENPVRTFVHDGNPWFVARDVCAILGLQNPSDAVSELDDDEKGVATSDPLSRGGAQQIRTISESGLYSLIFRSRKPEAKAFRRWVTGEVLPALRRTGSFTVDGAAEVELEPVLPEPLEWTLQSLISERQRALELILAGKVDAGTAQALASLMVEGRKHLDLLKAPPGELQEMGPATEGRSLLEAAATLLVDDGSYTIPELIRMAEREGLYQELLSVRPRPSLPSLAVAHGTLGRSLKPWLNRLLKDGRGRIFEVKHRRTRMGATYDVRFERPAAISASTHGAP